MVRFVHQILEVLQESTKPIKAKRGRTDNDAAASEPPTQITVEALSSSSPLLRPLDSVFTDISHIEFFLQVRTYYTVGAMQILVNDAGPLQSTEFGNKAFKDGVESCLKEMLLVDPYFHLDPAESLRYLSFEGGVAWDRETETWTRTRPNMLISLRIS